MLNERQLSDVIGCSLTKQEYGTILTAKGLIPPYQAILRPHRRYLTGWRSLRDLEHNQPNKWKWPPRQTVVAIFVIRVLNNWFAFIASCYNRESFYKRTGVGK